MSQVAEKSKLDELCEKAVSRDDERIVFTHKGRKFALMTFEEFDFLSTLEDRYDSELMDAALKEMEEKGEKPIPLEEIMKKYEIEG